MFQIIKSRIFLLVSLLVGFLAFVACVAFGTYSLFHLPHYDSETTATVSRLEFSHTETDSEGQDFDYYDVYVDYEIDGVAYKDVLFDQYSSDWEVGTTVTAHYNAAEPGVVSSGGAVLLPIFLFVFALANLVATAFEVKMLLTAR